MVEKSGAERLGLKSPELKKLRVERSGVEISRIEMSCNHFTAQILMLAYYGTWASARTMFTFCVHENEIGKIYASGNMGCQVSTIWIQS